MTKYKRGANSVDGTPADRRATGGNTGLLERSATAQAPSFKRQHGKSNGSTGSRKIVAPSAMSRSGGNR